MITRILVAIDGSAHAWKALELASDLARLYDAELVVIHVVPYEPLPEALRDFARVEAIPLEEEQARYHQSLSLGDALTRDAEGRARSKGVTKVKGHALEGRPADAILAAAEREGADLLVLGSRGLSDPKALLLGSVSHKVANLAKCTCVTVK